MKPTHPSTTGAQQRKLGFTGLVVVAASMMTVQAASVTFSSPTGVSDTSALDAPLTLSPGATLSQAVNFGSGDQTVSTTGGQTINFTGLSISFNAAPSGTATALFYAGSENNTALFTGDTGNAAFNSVLQGQGWASSGSSTSPETLRIGGLTQGTSYLVELLASDMRASSAARTEQYQDSLGGGFNASASFSTATPQYVLGTFTADASGYQDIFVMQTTTGVSTWDTTLAGFTLYAVPEPNTWVLLVSGLGMLFGLRIRRRKG